MAYVTDLGQCLLHEAAQQIQLQFSAKAALKFPQSIPEIDTLSYPTSISTLDSSYWIKEAPRLELSFLVRLSCALSAIASSFIPLLEKSISLSGVWSDLGFDIRRTESAGSSSVSTEHCLEFVLVRSNKRITASCRGLPLILHNPPDAVPPSKVPTVSLAGIQILLEYTYSPRQEDLNLHSMGSSAESPYYTAGYEDLYTCALDLFGPISMSRQDKSHLHPSQPVQHMLPLLDFGLQKLIFGSPLNNYHIKVLGEDTLENLSARAPAIFQQGHRDAMNQRAISLPMISDAMASVLGAPEGYNPNDYKSAIETSLWCIAQQGVRKHKAQRKSTAFFMDCPGSSNDLDMMDTSVGDEDRMLFESCPETDQDDESDGPLFDCWSDTSFQQICESLETSQDSLCLDYLPLVAPSIDSNALLSDDDLI